MHQLRRLPLVLPLLVACGTPISPLADAARRGDLVAIDRLLAEGADPHAGSGVNGWIPLLHAIHKNQEKAALRLLPAALGQPDELNRALLMASGYAQTAIVEALLARGADPHARDDDTTVLDNAVRGAFDLDYMHTECSEHTATVRALLAVAPDLASTVGKGARNAAERRGCSEMLALLGRF